MLSHGMLTTIERSFDLTPLDFDIMGLWGYVGTGKSVCQSASNNQWPQLTQTLKVLFGK